MFIPAEMSEVDIFCYQDDVEEVAQAVASLGVMHLMDANTLGKWGEDTGTAWSGRISTYAAYEARIRQLMERLGIAEESAVCEGRLDPRGDVARVAERLDAIQDQVNQLTEKVALLRRDIDRWGLTSRSLAILEPLSISLADLRTLEHVHMVAGTLPQENLARLEASLFRIPYNIIPLYRQGDRVLVFAFCAQEHAPILERALESAFLDPLALPDEYAGTAHDVRAQVEERIVLESQELETTQVALQHLAEDVAGELREMLVRVRGDHAMAEAMAHFGYRDQVYLIAGYVPTDEVPRLREAVEAVAGGRVTFEESAPYGPGQRTVPTLLRNGPLFRPMEALVSTYGVPGYDEIDPTPLVGVTFALMFGVMFGDLGSGLVLALLGALLMSRWVPSLERLAGAGVLFAACGLSSSIFGALYGSVFGIEDLIPALWLRPLDDIPRLLLASVGFGVVVLNLGFVAHLVTAARQKALLETLFDKNGVAGLLLYWSLGGLVLLPVLGYGMPWWLAGVAVVLAGSLMAGEPLTRRITGQKPLLTAPLGEFLVQSFFEVFEAVVSYLSNTLSYVRLGAFAVAHAGLSMVVFILAGMLGGSPAGAVLRVIILVLGNLAIIGFEGLIVAIQTLRLEYYELFGKFFKGAGVPFRPLTLPPIECGPEGL
ncbi:MAG: V-type ATP synthase subunit I [Anaerolineae bacterium]|jgi:V/A-type H+-transporting ATPase subunit I